MNKRILDLARHAAKIEHQWWFDPTENMDDEPHEHTQPFETCQQADCKLVREAVSVVGVNTRETP